MQVLTRRTKNNPVLIGEPGVGKTAIAEGLARRIVSGDVPETLKHKRLVAMDLSAMIAGAKYRGEFEDRLKAFLKEIVSSEGKIIAAGYIQVSALVPSSISVSLLGRRCAEFPADSGTTRATVTGSSTLNHPGSAA